MKQQHREGRRLSRRLAVLGVVSSTFLPHLVTQVVASVPPGIAIGSATGAPGAPVTVALSIAKNGATINVIAPLNFTFDSTRLTMGSCTSTISGKNPTVTVIGNAVGIAISGTEAVFPDGVFLNCTFTIKPDATGVGPMTFVSAGMADQGFNDYNASGTSGEVEIDPTLANIAIGSAIGAPGAQVTIGFSLRIPTPTINVIAPLNFTFDSTRLTMGSCTSTISGKNPTVTVIGNAVGIAISGTEAVFPDGVFLNCTFTIKPDAAGIGPVTFVSAGMADQDFNDYNATGTSGAVVISGGPVTYTATRSFTRTATFTRTPTVTLTATASRAPTRTILPSRTRTATWTPRPTATRTATRTSTATRVPSTQTATRSLSPSRTPTPSRAPSRSPSPSRTRTSTRTTTGFRSPSPTPTPTTPSSCIRACCSYPGANGQVCVSLLAMPGGAIDFAANCGATAGTATSGECGQECMTVLPITDSACG